MRPSSTAAITISATINRRRGDPDRNLDTARRGGVDRTLARDRSIGDLDDADLADAVAGLRCALPRTAGGVLDPCRRGALESVVVDVVERDLVALRRRASDPVWVRVFAGAPWVRVADFTAWPR
jgi:hypothetical protein